MDEKDFNIGDILEEKRADTEQSSDADIEDIAFMPNAALAAFINTPEDEDESADEPEVNDSSLEDEGETEAQEPEASDEDSVDGNDVPDEQYDESDEEYEAETEGTEEDSSDDENGSDDEADEEYYDDEEYEEDYDDGYEEEYDDEDDYNYRQHRSTGRKSKSKKFNNSIFGGLILVTVILTVSLVFAITGIKLGMEYLGVGKSEDDITFNIPESANTDRIVDILHDYNLINNKRLFKIALKFKHSPTLYPGDVTLKPSMGYAKIIDTLSTRRDLRETVRITFPEGMTLLEVADKLEANKVCSATDFIFQFNKQQDFAFEKLIDMDANVYYKLEGYCFPDTYEFYVGDTGSNVARIIKANFANKFTDEMLNTMQQKKLTINKVITLASIVQWEANSASDMPKVASVFFNRLDEPSTYPNLASDATKKYISKGIENDVDSATKDYYTNLYDTYKCEGLPVGPICNPGLDAIMAVLNPAETNYYFFCNNLSTGESFFAETYEQHKQNLIKAGLM